MKSEEIEIVKESFIESKSNPWEMFNDLTMEVTLSHYESYGLEKTLELIKYYDKRAYREEEYSAGML